MRSATVAMLAGLLPVVAANFAFWLNVNTGVNAGLEGCIPYWEGCYSVSRAVRSGEGLIVFKVLAVPSTVMMAWCWIRVSAFFGKQQISDRQYIKWAVRLGIAGAIFFGIYALWLGTEGEIYRWMRRYGVVFYFGFTGLAHLLLASSLWGYRKTLMHGVLYRRISSYFLLVIMVWVLGVGSAFKRKLVNDPEFLDRLENALEWNFALTLSLAYIALAVVFKATAKEPESRANSTSDVAD